MSSTLRLVGLLLIAAAAASEEADFAALHKYFNPTDRKEYTYTITSVMQFAKPFNVADMTDDYQDARVISQDEDSVTVEIVYYPLNTNKEGIGENRNWKRDYAGMTKYLRPTPTENWDEKMRADLIAQLRADGIDPDQLTDKELVMRVSKWLMRRSRYNKAFAIWYVHYPNGVPEVFPSLRKYFDREKPSPDWTDQAMFDQEVPGRPMFYNKVHGSCTSSAVYMATVMRALGIPTRIIFCDPPADGNDPKQREMLFTAIHHNAVRRDIRHGLPSGNGDFSNHLFNEVFVGNRWVRLNYDVLGQNNLDPTYFGLLTHILTTDSLSHVPMAETWGRRYATYAEVTPKLSSMNPYRLLKVSDHFGIHSNIANPKVEDEELRKVTVTETYWKDALPPAVRSNVKDPTGSDFYIGIEEYIPRYRLQMREFASHAGHDFVLSAPGHPDLKATLSGMKFSSGDTSPRYQLFGVKVAAQSKALFAPGVEYSIKPVNTSEVYAWTVKPGVHVAMGAQTAVSAPAASKAAFEVASVKPNKSGDRHSDTNISHDEDAMKLTLRNVSLLRAIQSAYQVKAYQIEGPDWLKSENYDIIANMPSRVPTAELWPALQGLLAERFKLATHRERRVMPIYEMVVGKNGVKVQPVDPNGSSGTWESAGQLTAKKETMEHFASVLSRIVDRPVIDKTGLDAAYDFVLEFNREGMQTMQHDSSNASSDASIFTALQEKLGLKLEAKKGPVEMLVIDHVEKVPTEN